MAHSYHHAISSARKWGGTPDDYQAVHDWLDGSKLILADFRHRALRHHAEGCFAAEALFGTTIVNATGRAVPVRLIAEQHSRISAASPRSRTGCAAFGPSRGWAGSANGWTGSRRSTRTRRLCMRDLALLRFTLEAVRELGDGGAGVLRLGREHQGWYAGAWPLNGQAVQDLIGDEWLRQSADGHEARINACPGFARPTDATAMPSEPPTRSAISGRQAEEYAEMGRDFPLFRLGPLFETPDSLDRSRQSGGPRANPPG